jgi:RNA polymerase-binding transcription factor DksA
MATTDTFKQKLHEELAMVEKELSSVGRINPANPNDWEAVQSDQNIESSDPTDVADTIEAYEESTGIVKQLEIRLNEIKNALKKIDDGTFGTCEICGKPIEEEKLMANPAARTCKEHVNEQPKS